LKEAISTTYPFGEEVYDFEAYEEARAGPGYMLQMPITPCIVDGVTHTVETMSQSMTNKEGTERSYSRF